MTTTIIFLAAYFIALLAIGIWSRKWKTGEDYLLANRHVGSFQIAASIFALIGGGELATLSSLSYSFGFAAIWYFVGLAIGMILLGIMGAKLKTLADSRKFYTLSDYFLSQFDRKNAMLSAAIVFISFLALLVIQFVAGGALLATLLGWPYPITVLITGAIIVFYLVLGGFRAVLRTDIFQALVMLVLALVVVVTIRTGDVSTSQLDFFAMEGLSVLNLVLVGILVIFASADIWQRLYAARNRTSMLTGLAMAALGFLLFGIMLSVIGIAAANNLPDINADDALFSAITELLPPAVASLALVLIFAAIMSTADTEIFLLSTMVSRDFTPTSRSDEQLARITRGSVLGVTLLALLISLFFQDLVLIYFSLLGLLVALSPAIIASFFWRLNPNVVFISVLGGVMVVVGMLFAGVLTPDNSVLSAPAALIILLLGHAVVSATGTPHEPTQRSEDTTITDG